ncbi:DNA repair protein RecN [Aeromicrobium marinum DSM 15272]|uniref:DNA repair protein RecN n=1 Tax=Aeromicrobium marinum DSM 15272 TaxID=585531 RepID=E2S9L7_9ACTN|nr:DNA repair protein RecN [Aeromicrobium marinum]EFQ83941.1 DNA repair protein RecN [Aeromicrobium marinum DSM 15272]
MWHHLALRSLGVIEEAELELDAGFTVITGETGAGKTMVVTALGLLRGDRADPGLVRHGAEQARVEAEISVGTAGRVRAAVEEAGGSVDDTVVVARSVSAKGRSRAHAGGATVPAALLTEITDELVAVHGQSDQHRLLRPTQQRAALDLFCGDELAALRSRYDPAWARWREIDRRLDELTHQAAERAREADALRLGLEEIEQVAPVAGEDDELRAEETRLAHAESLALAADEARGLLVGDAERAEAHAGAGAELAAATSALEAVAQHDPTLDDLVARAREAAILVSELGTDLAGYSAGIDIDPGRLAQVQDRRGALQGLVRKYGPTVDDVLTWAQEGAARLTELDGDDDTIVELRAEHDRLTVTVRDLARAMSQVRAAAGARLGALVDTELAQLSMPAARLTVEVRVLDDREPGPHGIDEVELLFAANSGAGARPLHKGASGGELSRLMLAIEVVLADRSTVPTLVFDEVDAGIGGKAAVEVGRRLAALSDHAQVIAVTHLPQVAAFAQHHFRVLRDDDGNVTSSSVVRLSGQDRVDELARMLAGQEDSTSAQAHARELLGLAGR